MPARARQLSDRVAVICVADILGRLRCIDTSSGSSVVPDITAHAILQSVILALTDDALTHVRNREGFRGVVGQSAEW